MAAYRASKHEATGFSPNFLVLGEEVRAPLDLVLGEPVSEPGEISYEGFVEDKIKKMQEAYALVRENLRQSANRSKKYYDMRVKPQTHEVGEWVYFYSPRKFVGKSPKWQKMYSGPYLIVKQLGPVNFVLQQSKRGKPFVVHVDKIKKCKGDTPASWLSDPEKAEEEIGNTEGPSAEELVEMFKVAPELLETPIETENLSNNENEETPVKQIVEDAGVRDRPLRTKNKPAHLADYV